MVTALDPMDMAVEDSLILERGLLMLNLRLMLMLMLILLFFMVPMDMVCRMLDMLDMDMVPMVMALDPMDMAVEDSLIWERGPLMLSQKQRLMLMLILLFFMVPMDMVCHMLDMQDMDMVPIVMDLELMDMAILMDMANSLTLDENQIVFFLNMNTARKATENVFFSLTT